MDIIKSYLTINPYSRPGTQLKQVKQIVIHWVGNVASTAKANRNYFEGLKTGQKMSNGKYRYASAHYIVGLDGEIMTCVPETEVAYHAGEANASALGIEVCHQDWQGKFGSETYEVLIGLIVDICKRYKLDPLRDIIRHYDVTGKDCPSYYVKNIEAWQRLKQDVKDKLDIQKINIQVNGNVKEVQAILRAGSTYVKLRDLADEAILVDYDSKKKLPIIKVK